MNKADYVSMGVRMARQHWAEGRGFYCVSGVSGWRDRAYRAGYDAAWSMLTRNKPFPPYQRINLGRVVAG